jgi:hypothetical protein
VVQRALRRKGDWEVVAAVAADRAERAERWLTDAVTVIVGSGWETRLQPLGPSLATLALRSAPDGPPSARRRRARRR